MTDFLDSDEENAFYAAIAELDEEEDNVIVDPSLEKEFNHARPTAPEFFAHAGSPTLLQPPVPRSPPRGLGSGESVTPAEDLINSPSHYQSSTGLEAIVAIEAAVQGLSGFEGYCLGNAIKYSWRHDKKGGSQDLDKAQWYLRRLREYRDRNGKK